MDPNDLPRKIDPLNSSLVLVCLVAGGLAFTLGASHLGKQFGVHGATELAAAAALWLVAWHFKRLGRLY